MWPILKQYPQIFLAVRDSTRNFRTFGGGKGGMVRINTVFRILVGKSGDNKTIERPGVSDSTGMLISPYPDQEGNKLMFLLEWREFPSAPCLAGHCLKTTGHRRLYGCVRWWVIQGC